MRNLLAGYRPLAGAHDEMMRSDGSLRPPWDRFLSEVASFGPSGLTEAFDRVDRHIRESGVIYPAYVEGNGGERPWPLAPLPLLIGPNEWEGLEAGVIPRARLAEALIAGVYGEGRLARCGVLPAAAIAGSPDFLRPLVGLPPPGGRRLYLYAVDLGRGPDGTRLDNHRGTRPRPARRGRTSADWTRRLNRLRASALGHGLRHKNSCGMPATR